MNSLSELAMLSGGLGMAGAMTATIAVPFALPVTGALFAISAVLAIGGAIKKYSGDCIEANNRKKAKMEEAEFACGVDDSEVNDNEKVGLQADGKKDLSELTPPGYIESFKKRMQGHREQLIEQNSNEIFNSNGVVNSKRIVFHALRD